MAARFAARVMNGGEVGADFRDAASGNEHGEVHPVSADVRNGSEVAAKFGFESPVPVGRKEQPVLMKFSMNEQRFADGAGFHQRACLLAERGIAQVMRNAADEARFLLDAFKRLRFARIHRKRFLAKNMLSGAQQGAGLFE